MEVNDTKQLIKSALRLLGARDHFSAEIVTKLKSKGATDDQVAEVLEYLNKFKYLNDIKTLSKFAGEIASSGKGVNFFKRKLYEKGVLELFSKDVFPVETELTAAKIFIKKRGITDGDEILKKLLSRGFSNEAAFLILKELKKEKTFEDRSDI